jgi:hypothetical protein
MKILSTTSLQRKKLKEMISKVFPNYKYVRISPKGKISLSRSFWYMLFGAFKTIDITEMCMVLIPEQLDKLYMATFEGEQNGAYERVYNQYSHIVLDLIHHRSKSIIDYLYDEYVHIKYGLKKNYYYKANVLQESTETLKVLLANPVREQAIVLSRLSTISNKIYIERWMKSLFILNHPKLYSSYLDLWLRKYFKEQIRDAYSIRISSG